MKIIEGGDGERFEIIGISLPVNIGKDQDGLFIDPDLYNNPLENIERAGRTCYRSEEKITKDSAKAFVKMLKDAGHHAMLEHSSLTVRFFNTSRGFTHELVRHRLCAFGQESTRYVDESKFQFVIPPNIDIEKINDMMIEFYLYDRKYNFDLETILEIYKQTYEKLQTQYGLKKQDARQFLPIGITNDIVVTANFREWMHIFKMRTSSRAHWEIRCIMLSLLRTLQSIIPIIFDDFIISDNKDSYGIGHAVYGGK
jgi:thymidylate synthase (FAD)